MRHANICAAYLILMRAEKVLLLMRKNTGYHDGEYSLIAGHVEQGESFTDTIVREAKEEADIEIDPLLLDVVHVMHRKSSDDKSERVDVYFQAKKWKGKIDNKEPKKCFELCWFQISHLPANTVPEVSIAISNSIRGLKYSEHGWD